MTSVSQIVPTYAVGGISNQPDELKKPGQVRDCLNAFPDLIEGLYKRNGFQQVSELTTACVGGNTGSNGSWFNFVRENPASKTIERFIGKVTRAGKVFVWNCATGAEVDVYYSSTALDPTNAEGIDINNLQTCFATSYLSHDRDESLRFNSVNDYTFITNPAVAVTMGSRTGKRPYEAFIEITQLAAGREYILNVDLIDSDSETSFNTVRSVDLSDVTEFGSDRKDPSCPANYNNPEYEVDATFLRSSADTGQTGLILSVVSTGTNVPDDDGDYYCTYRHEIEVVNGGRNWNVGDRVRLFQNGTSENTDGETPGYTVEITGVDTISAYAEYIVSGVTTPTTGNETLRVATVLDELKAALIAQAGFTEEQVEIIGNGIYVTRGEPFIISTSEKDLMNILSNEDRNRENPVVVVNNPGRLPLECKDGIIAKVSNSFSGEDDYWVQFRANYGQATNGNGAAGYWEEIAQPGGKTAFNSGTMPHALVYARSGNATVFVIAPIKWSTRSAGDFTYNPSFVSFSINHVSFFRNRLVFLSQENVIMSKAGDLFNFFPSSALQVSPIDPIDISSSTDYSAVLQSAVIINNGLVLFSNYQQFLLTTDSDILDPSTAKITEISRYEYDTKSEPFAIGTNIGFLGTSDNNTRLYELSGIFREGSVEINERSAIIRKSLPPIMNLVAHSKETGLLMLGRKGDGDIWCYRYFKQGAERELQSTWFRWKSPYTILYHTIFDDKYYAVLKKDESTTILSYVSLETMQGPYIDLGDIPYEMKVEFPTIHMSRREQQTFAADTTSSLVLHRIIFNLADIGSYYINIERKGMDNYNMLYESRYMDDFAADAFPTYPKAERNIPVYTRNENLDITLTSSFQHPIILRSMRWEGDYNPRYYRRV